MFSEITDIFWKLQTSKFRCNPAFVSFFSKKYFNDVLQKMITFVFLYVKALKVIIKGKIYFAYANKNLFRMLGFINNNNC